MYISEYERRKEEARQRWWKRRVERYQEALDEEVSALIEEAEKTRLLLAPLYRLSDNGKVVKTALDSLLDMTFISETVRSDFLLGALRSVLCDPTIESVSKRFFLGFGTGAHRAFLDVQGSEDHFVEAPVWPPLSSDHPFVRSLFGTSHPLHKQALVELIRGAYDDKLQLIHAAASDEAPNSSEALQFSSDHAFAIFVYVLQLIEYGIVLVENDFVRQSRAPHEHYDYAMSLLEQELHASL